MSNPEIKPVLRDVLTLVKCRYCSMGFLTEADRYEHEKTHMKGGADEYVKCYNCQLRPSCGLYARYVQLKGSEKSSYRVNVIEPCGLYVPKE